MSSIKGCVAKNAGVTFSFNFVFYNEVGGWWVWGANGSAVGHRSVIPSMGKGRASC